jgi:hypothetical protein
MAKVSKSGLKNLNLSSRLRCLFLDGVFTSLAVKLLLFDPEIRYLEPGP